MHWKLLQTLEEVCSEKLRKVMLAELLELPGRQVQSQTVLRELRKEMLVAQSEAQRELRKEMLVAQSEAQPELRKRVLGVLREQKEREKLRRAMLRCSRVGQLEKQMAMFGDMLRLLK